MPPAGFKRSRALWDEARHPRQSDSTNNNKKLEQGQAYVRAICYELQPIRFSQVDISIVISTVRVIGRTLAFFIKRTPYWVLSFIQFAKTLTRQQWLILAGVVAYYFFVRLVHELLDAGPIVLILTSLVAIFTMGLGDEDVNNPDRVSAYSVFNRGFQRIMGSVDVDSLLAQHVGGGMMMGGLGGGGGGADIMDDDPVPRRRGAGGAGGVARRPRPEPQNEEFDADENGGEAENDNNNNNRGGGGGGARKSGKKARRRNLEQRRDVRRQREAAMALGVQVDETAGPEEMMEIQRLIEEQIAAEQQQQNGQHNID